MNPSPDEMRLACLQQRVLYVGAILLLPQPDQVFEVYPFGARHRLPCLLGYPAICGTAYAKVILARSG